MQGFDVIVVGAGHAGCEAALVAARLGARTAIVTIPGAGFATMPCNPAVGGIAKSHLVYELDALGGEIGRNADATGLQFRVLNTSRGPAVRATRVQCDKDAYAARMQAVIENTPGLTVVPAQAGALWIENGRLRGIKTIDDAGIPGTTVVVTTGTFLKGRIHVGDQCTPGGRRDTPASEHLSKSLADLGFRLGRLKTGTPPRLHKDSLDYARMEIQPGLEPPPFFSWWAERHRQMFHVEQRLLAPGVFHVEHSHSHLYPWVPGTNQMPCYLTHTTAETHAIIRENLGRSSLYGGAITGTGVRYCPSIEDKVVKFADKETHHVFLEPEGRRTDRMYPNGISNSLPPDVQERMVRSIPGFERAAFLAWAYAIEYDFSDPTQLFHTLETKLVENLFMAGQINGTTGYEEAAAQGWMAGANAALKALGRKPIQLGRHEAYLGVLVDDLVTKGVDEPYRMFTSRAEHRLLLRQDNARFRLLDLARTLDVTDPAFLRESETLQRDIELELLRWRQTAGGRMAQQLRMAGVGHDDVAGADRSLAPVVKQQIEIEIKYEGYVLREQRLVARAREGERVKIPLYFDYSKIKSMRVEAREKLARHRPETLGQAARMAGVNPSDVAILSVMLRR